MTSNFKQKVLTVVHHIPKGSTLTYAEVARRAGHAHAYRAVGNILHRNHDPSIPCHRVIRSDGSVGGYNRGIAMKKKLLRKERAMLYRTHTMKSRPSLSFFSRLWRDQNDSCGAFFGCDVYIGCSE